LVNQQAEVEILKNQLSAFAGELASKRNRIALLEEELLVKKQRLQHAQAKFESNRLKLQK
jgi:hypothetical protein